MVTWTVQIRDQSARSVQSDLELHCPQELLVSSTVGLELREHLLSGLGYTGGCGGGFSSLFGSETKH